MKLYVVGIGPGELSQITPAAMAAMEQSDIIAGYTVYVDLVRERFPGKTFLTTAMKQEVDRCRMAIEQAVAGKTVSMVCSGDAGVYGMAGLIYELAQQYPPIEIEVIPGITAAMSGGGGAGCAAHPRFCGHQPQRPADPIGKNHDPRRACSAGRLCSLLL